MSTDIDERSRDFNYIHNEKAVKIINQTTKYIRAIFPVTIQENSNKTEYGYYIYFNTNISEHKDQNMSENGIIFNCTQEGFVISSNWNNSIITRVFTIQCVIIRQRLFIQLNVQVDTLPDGFSINYNGQSALLPEIEAFNIIKGTNDSYWWISETDAQIQKNFINTVNILRRENNVQEVSIFNETIAMIKADDMAINNYIAYNMPPFYNISMMVTKVNPKMNFYLNVEAIYSGGESYKEALRQFYFSSRDYTVLTQFQAYQASYFRASRNKSSQYKHSLAMHTDAYNISSPANYYPLRGHMIFKFKRESLEPNITECVFSQLEPNINRVNESEAYLYNTRFVIDNTDMIRAYGLPLGIYIITCGTKNTTVRLQMQSYIRILEVDMNQSFNFDIEAPQQLSGVFNVSKGQLLTFQAGIPLYESSAIQYCRDNGGGSACLPPEVSQVSRRRRRLGAFWAHQSLNLWTEDPLYLRYAAQNMSEYAFGFVEDMQSSGGGEPDAEQPLDPYGGTFIPASGVGPTITPNGTGAVGGWTPPGGSPDSGPDGPGDLDKHKIIIIAFASVGAITTAGMAILISILVIRRRRRYQHLRLKQLEAENRLKVPHFTDDSFI